MDGATAPSSRRLPVGLQGYHSHQERIGNAAVARRRLLPKRRKTVARSEKSTTAIHAGSAAKAAKDCLGGAGSSTGQLTAI